MAFELKILIARVETTLEDGTVLRTWTAFSVQKRIMAQGATARLAFRGLIAWLRKAVRGDDPVVPSPEARRGVVALFEDQTDEVKARFAAATPFVDEQIPDGWDVRVEM